MQPLLLTLFVGLFIAGGILLGLAMNKDMRLIDLSIGTAFGVIVMLIILELSHEALDNIGLTPTWVNYLFTLIVIVIGFLIFNILDKIVPHCHDGHKNKKVDCHFGNLGVLACVVLIIHNILEGMTLFVAADASITTGYLLCIGIGLHNLPMGMMVAGSIHSKKQLTVFGLLLTISTFIGGLVMQFIGPFENEFVIGVLFALTIGMLGFIAIVELFNQIRHSRNKGICVAGMLLGIGIIGLSVLLG